MSKLTLDTLRRLGTKSALTQTNYSDPLGPGRQSSFGSPITDSFYGINYLQTPLPVPMNKDHYGMIFFTRPQLNLQTPNLEKEPRFSDYLTTVPNSIFRAARCYLDPRLQLLGDSIDVQGNLMSLNCPLVDPLNCFIPLLSNHAVSASGFQDKILPIYRSPEGLEREVYSMADGITEIYNANQMPVTFRNSKNDPITKLFDLWVDYPGLVFKGTMTKYVDYILGGLLDYQTRIYRLTLDASKTYVTGIAATGVAFPSNVTKAQQYDFNIDKPYNDANNQITIQFETNGIFYEDPRMMKDFNTIVGAFNPAMVDETAIEREMQEITGPMAVFFNCRAYPRIDLKNKKLRWYVSKPYFDSIYGEAQDLVNHMIDRSTEVFTTDDGDVTFT